MNRSEHKHLEALVALLAAEEGNDAETAQWSLEDEFGYRCVTRVVEMFPNLGEWGMTCALDLLVSLTVEPPPSELIRQLIEDAVLPMLGSGFPLHRQYSAKVLAAIGCKRAIEPIVGAFQQSIARGIPANWVEPWSFSGALDELRSQVKYESAWIQGHRVDVGTAGFGTWFVADGLQILDELLGSQQLVFGIQTWTKGEEGQTWDSGHHESWDWVVDFSTPVDRLIVEAHQHASEYLRSILNPDRTLVAMDWLCEADLHHGEPDANPPLA